jgi:hypothetical protein
MKATSEKFTQKFYSENLKARDYFGNTDTNWKTILKWMLNTQGARTWNRFIRLR